ncbi:unnamed protein product [Periconia digitata]|uniref:Uncharacterized protein n=1 Tax=Periconia digitata TaxID=1303443 RepID=A0A9W4U4L3_9PLEO|nr:unnamed protein product [Periconia digitata]
MEKSSLLPQTQSPPRARASILPKRPTRFHGLLFVLVLGLYFLSGSSWKCEHKQKHNESVQKTKVPLEVHIMSKCPDARDCLEKLVVPAMANVSSKVNFTLSFIGKTTEEDDGVQCKHGQTECLGNIVELCAAASYPDPKAYLGFTMCLERDYAEIPKQSFIEECALEHGLSFATLNDCMSKDDGAYGMGLLRESVRRSQALGVKLSCTVRLEGKTRCIRDGGEWSDCEGGSEPSDLIKDIEKLYGGDGDEDEK